MSFGLDVASSAIDTTLGLGANFANGAIQNYYWEKQYDKTRADYLADRQHQEEYNSPENQMKLLAEAGLNPNLVYGKFGGAGASGTSSPQQTQAKGVSPSNSTGNLAAIMSARAQQKQAELQETAISAKAELDRSQANYYNSMSPYWQAEISQRIEESKASVQKIYQDISTGKSQEELNKAKTNLTVAEELLAQADHLLRQGQISQLDYQNAEIVARTAMYTQQAWYYHEQWYLAELDQEIKQFQIDINDYLKQNNGIETIGDAQLKTIGHELALLATKAHVEGNEVNAWVHSIAPLVFELDTHVNKWYSSVQSAKKKNKSSLSDEQIQRVIKYTIAAMGE